MSLNPDDKKRIAEIREREKNATDGPPSPLISRVSTYPKEKLWVAGGVSMPQRLAKHDAVFYFHAHTDIPYLLDLVERLEAREALLREALERFAKIKADNGDTFDSYSDETIIRCEITARDLRQARDALKGEG